MQVVRSAERETLSLEEQTEWLRVLDQLGEKRQLLVVSKGVEQNLGKAGVAAFLYELWQTEERERRHREGWLKPAIGIGFFTVSLTIVALAIWTALAIMWGYTRPTITLSSLIALYVCLSFPTVYLMRKRQRQRALAFLLTNGPVVPPCALLIEALPFGNFDQDAKARLSKVLPGFHDTDAPVLDKHQHQTLLRELESGLTKGMYPKKCISTDTDIAFLAATIRYFEREATRGNPIREKLQTLLQRFVHYKSMNGVSPHWNSVAIAVERFLAQGR